MSRRGAFRLVRRTRRRRFTAASTAAAVAASSASSSSSPAAGTAATATTSSGLGFRRSRMFVPTLREDPGEAAIPSHKLLLRAGYIRRCGGAAGVFSMLPMGQRVVDKLTRLIDTEMQRIGANKMALPSLLPAELWRQSGRWDTVGGELFRLQDRRGAEFCLAPTHEEALSELVAGAVASYKQLPLTLYQIGPKYRDEQRPRFGLMRGREFLMKDAYSFHASRADALDMYDTVSGAYDAVFGALGPTVKVEADGGNIGGSLSHEYHFVSDVGEDALLVCKHCGYAANVEKATSQAPEQQQVPEEQQATAQVHVVVYDPPVAADISGGNDKNGSAPDTARGDGGDGDHDALAAVLLLRPGCEVNPVKVKPALVAAGLPGAEDVDPEHLRLLDPKTSDASGPDAARRRTLLERAGAAMQTETDDDTASRRLLVCLDDAVAATASDSTAFSSNGVAGNGNDAQDQAVVAAALSDAAALPRGDFRMSRAGDTCVRCPEWTSDDASSASHTPSILEERRGIEVGQVFHLGTKYSRLMGATVVDAANKAVALDMGCYGIGVSRVVAAIVEQQHDDRGIVWPAVIAPFAAIVVAANKSKQAEAEGLFDQLRARPSLADEVVLDDRWKDRLGPKLAEAELVGFPLTVVVGRDWPRVELQHRATGTKEVVEAEDLPRRVEELAARGFVEEH